MKKSGVSRKGWLVLLLTAVLSLLVGGFVGLQLFCDDFSEWKENIQLKLGYVTEEELAVRKAEEYKLFINAKPVRNDAAADDKDDAEVIPEELKETHRIVTVNGTRTAIDLAAGSHTWFDAKQMSSETVNEFELTGDFTGYDVWFDGKPIKTGETVTFEVDSIALNSSVKLKLVSQETGKETLYFMRALNADYNTVSKGEGVEDGYYYFAQSNHLYKMDSKGNLVFFKTVDNLTFDFKAYQFEGKTYYTYMERIVNEFDDSIAVSSMQVKAVVMDENYKVIDEITTLSTDKGLAEHLPLDMHEFVMLGVDHYILCAYVGKEVDNIQPEYNASGVATLATTVIQEVKDGELLFQWQSSDYPEFYTLNLLNNPGTNDLTGEGDKTVDYVHFNAIHVDPVDGNFILSFRRISAGVKIDRTTGEIIWVFGGEGDEFGLKDEQKFSRQHTIYHADDETITVFDNGNAYNQTYFRSYVLDETKMKVKEYECYSVDGKFCPFMGSLQRLNDDALYLIGWGGGSNDGVLLSEIDFSTGVTEFEILDPDATFVADDNSYRVYKFAY